MNYKYKFSVIVPVYNVEEYLAEALDSVINQSIGFEENVQIIIVNDGSTDNSADICKKYRDMYPGNIVYVEKENGGVSSARNEGIKYVEGKYVNFLDSDDKWDLNAFSTAYDFFEKHYDEIDVVVCRVEFFERKDGYHSLDYKFNKGTRIADINNPDEYFSLNVFATCLFIKAETAEEFRFDTRMRYSEDTAYYGKIILEKCKIGLIKEAVFYYRKRLAETSAVDKLRRDKFYYIETLDYFHKELFDYSIKKFGKVIPHIQALALNNLYWYFNAIEIHDVLNEEEFKIFKKKVKALLNQIDDSILFGIPNHKNFIRRSVAVNFKYDTDYFKSLTLRENELYFREFMMFDLENVRTQCVLNSVSADNKKFRVEILFAKWLLESTADGGKLVLKVGERFIKPKEMLEYTQKTVRTINGGEYYYTSCIFDIKLKLKQGETVQILPHIIYGDKTIPLRLNYRKFTSDQNRLKSCLVQGKYTVLYEDDAIQISFTKKH